LSAVDVPIGLPTLLLPPMCCTYLPIYFGLWFSCLIALDSIFRKMMNGSCEVDVLFLMIQKWQFASGIYGVEEVPFSLLFDAFSWVSDEFYQVHLLASIEIIIQIFQLDSELHWLIFKGTFFFSFGIRVLGCLWLQTPGLKQSSLFSLLSIWDYSHMTLYLLHWLILKHEANLSFLKSKPLLMYCWGLTQLSG
jgi:hypothetical protein